LTERPVQHQLHNLDPLWPRPNVVQQPIHCRRIRILLARLRNMTHAAVTPPSTGSMTPVTQLASSEAR